MEKSKPTMKTCYYELLEVDRVATQKEIERVTNTIIITLSICICYRCFNIFGNRCNFFNRVMTDDLMII